MMEFLILMEAAAQNADSFFFKIEPDTYNAIKFGTVLENVKFFNKNNRIINDDISITENTKAAYPL